MANITLDDIDVIVEFRNRENERTGDRRYALTEYTAKLDSEIKHCIAEVECAFTAAHREPGYDVKADVDFIRVRRALLNASNAIGRLPSSIRCNGDFITNKSLGAFIADKIG